MIQNSDFFEWKRKEVEYHRCSTIADFSTERKISAIASFYCYRTQIATDLCEQKENLVSCVIGSCM